MIGAGTNRTRESQAGGPVIVLVRPQLAVNIGMCARAMVNFGLCDLRLVAPRGGWPPEEQYLAQAEAAAAGAAHVLAQARVFATIAEAVADLHYVWATTARERGQVKRVAAPAEAMAESAKAMGAERHGILFGPERTGMENDEVALADAIVTFPANPAYASLNLAQAVLLMGYEWMQASDHGVATGPGVPERSPPAPREMILSFFEYIESELEKVGFFRPVGKGPVMRRNLRNIFHRLAMTEQDVRTLRGAIVRLVEGPRAAAAKARLARAKRSAQNSASDAENG